ncbi:MAG: Asp-tRNA(Asn)/Glu-tRNA(Gln) amidotransferase subunit GatC [Phycisphaerales bacterium]|nr:Asp-tRNA(Asn)/Glu-tRNA(Gln) amidotransferase subunit GatC [Phycisphaerales bacterium]
MALSADEVRRVAALARLALTQEQVERYRADLAAVLGYMERLRGLDLAGALPLAHVGEEVNRLDADEPGPVLPDGVLQKMAPATWAGGTGLQTGVFIKVPKVLGGGGGA